MRTSPTRGSPCGAIDMAAHDLWGKLRGAPVWKLWGLGVEKLPVTDVTIGIDTIEVMVQKLHEFPNWPIYKIKLGTLHDLEIVQTLRQHTAATFRVDANCAWGVDEAIANAAALKPLGVEFIEQPLPPKDWERMRRVYRESALPIIADESCCVEADVDRCAACFHGINIKLIKCGGLTPARRMIARARQHGLRTMVGCMTESTVSISAIAAIAAAIGLRRYGRCAAVGRRHRHGRAHRRRPDRVSRREWLRRAVAAGMVIVSAFTARSA